MIGPRKNGRRSGSVAKGRCEAGCFAKNGRPLVRWILARPPRPTSPWAAPVNGPAQRRTGTLMHGHPPASGQGFRASMPQDSSAPAMPGTVFPVPKPRAPGIVQDILAKVNRANTAFCATTLVVRWAAAIPISPQSYHATPCGRSASRSGRPPVSPAHRRTRSCSPITGPGLALTSAHDPARQSCPCPLTA